MAGLRLSGFTTSMTTNTAFQPFPLEVTFEQLAELFALYTDFPVSRGSFSCSPTGEVWPRDKTGYHVETQRRYVTGRSVLLDTIVALVLHVAPEGGALDIDINGASMRRSNQMIVTFDLCVGSV